MTQVKYLYGASVQGIQSFIFQTNELKDVVGASELVEKICTDMFDEFLKHDAESKQVVKAAGNVKCIFSNREACARAVREFPKTVMEAAPGITISQAVATLKPDESDFKEQMEVLESRLHVQRNRPQRSLTYGTMGMLHSRKTGLPVVKVVVNKKETDGKEYLDAATQAKRKNSKPNNDKNSTLLLAKKFFGNEYLKFNSLAFDIEELTDENNDWIAIIHADGNGLGQIVAKKNNTSDELHEFSENLNKATEKAAQQAFQDIVKSDKYNADGNVIPIRPVVLGGDDMTVICRASIAMDYVKAYIEHFEENTEKCFGSKEGLTACAGIAYQKSSYPFHYGYELAEALCEEAKRDAKREDHREGHLKDGKIPSCIMFHKIQGSYIDSFSQIKENELTINSQNRLNYGPYYLKPIEGRWTIDDLRKNANMLLGDDGNVIKSAIRKWLTIMHEDTALAGQLENRESQKQNNKVKALSEGGKSFIFDIATTPQEREKDEDGNPIFFYPAYDMLQLLTVENQVTKTNKDNQ